MSRQKSEQLFEEAKQYLPGGVNSPVRAFKSVNGSPIFFEKGKGAHVWDEDGNKYVDFCCSWGPLILGHAHDGVLAKVSHVMANGTSFGAPTEQENLLAELIISNHKNIEKIRFVSSGTEAVMSALRLARGVTGKSKVVKFDGCYHGHVDSMLVSAGSGLVTLGESSSAGIPDAYARETIVVPLNDIPALEQAFSTYANDIACVIIEPVPANNGLLIQDPTFLEELRELCTKHGILLIFDEVISGFRLGFEGASGQYNIQPDIITFGKIIGGGLPVGAYAASKEIMGHVSPDGGVYQAGTLSGNPMAMAAGYAQLKECLKPGFYPELKRKTDRLVSSVMSYAKGKDYMFKMYNTESIFWMAFTDKVEIRKASEISASSMEYFKPFHESLLNQGIYIGPSGYEVGFVSAAHSDADIDKAIVAFRNALDAAFQQTTK